MENQGPRKATDVLLDLETKLETALNIIKAQDLNMKLLSNKLNMLIEKLDKQPNSFVPQKNMFSAEAVQTAVPPQFAPPPPEAETQVPVYSEYKIPIEEAPTGFRRTSRPETFAGDNSYLNRSAPQQPVQMPTQTPKPPPGRSLESEVIIPQQAMKQGHVQPPSAPMETKVPQEQKNRGSIPVEQRVVDKNGKSVFLADVEIIDLTTGNQVCKTRTSGNGKWAAPLTMGNYRVTINKRESMSKQKIEVVQDITVDGSQSPLVLQMMIIK